MTELSTTYLGIPLKSPLVVSAAQPLSDTVDHIRRMEDAGAAAVVLYSLFEEQLIHDRYELNRSLMQGEESYAESLTYFPDLPTLEMGPTEYLRHIESTKRAVRIPVIASLNGATVGGWTKFARDMETAGADAIELNIYWVAADADLSAADIEDRYHDIVASVKSSVSIPVAVKLSPYFSSLANFVTRLDQVGAAGFVLFNRFYQPDFDLENLCVRPNVILSTPQAMRLPLRWIAILHGRIVADLAASGGIHRAEDAVKMILAGASVTMMASALMRYGIGHIASMEAGIREWMEENEYDSVEQMRGAMSQRHIGDPSEFERVQYMRAIAGYRPEYPGI